MKWRAMTAWPLAFVCPASATPSDADWQSFRAEVARIEKLPISAPDKNTVIYQMARTWASAKQWPETMEWLRKVAALNAGFDPSGDSIFAGLHGTSEFEEILAAALRATPVAYDPRRQRFYFGSLRKALLRLRELRAMDRWTWYRAGHRRAV